MKTIPLESALKTMSSAPTPIPYTPPALPPGGAPPKGLALPVEKSSFLFLAIGLMVLGICFFIAGFLFSLWIQKNLGHIEKNVTSSAHSSAAPSTLAPHKSETHDPTPSAPPSPGVNASSTSSSNKPIEAPTQTASPDTTNVRYAIQLGAFVTRENANDLMDKLKARQISSKIQEEQDSSGSPIFCVRTTHEFVTYKAAESAANSLFHQEAISAFVIPMTNVTKKA